MRLAGFTRGGDAVVVEVTGPGTVTRTITTATPTGDLVDRRSWQLPHGDRIGAVARAIFNLTANTY